MIEFSERLRKTLESALTSKNFIIILILLTYCTYKCRNNEKFIYFYTIFELLLLLQMQYNNNERALILK